MGFYFCSSQICFSLRGKLPFNFVSSFLADYGTTTTVPSPIFKTSSTYAPSPIWTTSTTETSSSSISSIIPETEDQCVNAADIPVRPLHVIFAPLHNKPNFMISSYLTAPMTNLCTAPWVKIILAANFVDLMFKIVRKFALEDSQM